LGDGNPAVVGSSTEVPVEVWGKLVTDGLLHNKNRSCDVKKMHSLLMLIFA